MKELLEKYAELKNQIKVAEEQVKELAPQVMDAMNGTNNDKVDAEGIGTFSIANRKTWTYGPEVKALKNGLEGEMRAQQADGTATFTENPYLLFKEAKEEDAVA